MNSYAAACGLARALVIKQIHLLMDEPFSALDVEILRTDLLDLWIEGQMTQITHNIEKARL